MRFLSGKEEKTALKYLDLTLEEALKSTCKRARCGSIIIKENKIIGRGFNSPPGNKETQRRCDYPKKLYHQRITDKTCCVHAEQRAIIDALINHPNKIYGSKLYFTRVNNKSNHIKSGKPYCTICSKLALDIGIEEFVLWHSKGVCVYNTEEYNLLSFRYAE